MKKNIKYCKFKFTLLFSIVIALAGCSGEKNSELKSASIKGNLKKVKQFIKQGADVNYQGNTGDTSLIVATVARHKEVVKLLLANGADPNLQNLKGETALMWASVSGFTEIAKTLIQNKAKPDFIKKESGKTALIFASRRGTLATVRLLLENRANPNIMTFDGKTALDYAIDKNFTDVTELLRKHGAKTAKELNKEKSN